MQIIFKRARLQLSVSTCYRSSQAAQQRRHKQHGRAMVNTQHAQAARSQILPQKGRSHTHLLFGFSACQSAGVKWKEKVELVLEVTGEFTVHTTTQS